jgi:tetratricopeptide (TPR) repeat protein
VLNNTTWSERREKLETQGGPPTTGPRWSLDPILFGTDPTARAKAWMERKRWAEAEAAFDEAVVARPFDSAILLERARFLAAHSPGHKADDDFARAYFLGDREPALLDRISSSEPLFRRAVAEPAGPAEPLWVSRGEYLAKRQLWTEAAAAYGEAVRLGPQNDTYRARPYLGLRAAQYHHHQILALLAAGDHNGLRRTRTDMLDRFRLTINSGVANDAAWACVMAACEEPNLGETVRLAEFAVNKSPSSNHLKTLGAALYRAGRFAEAVRRLDEGIQKRAGQSGEADCVFLAMAHHRLGHHDEARRWLDRFRDRSPNLDRSAFWDEFEIRLLRAEAETVVLWDPIFPVDPFAP